MYNIGLNSEYFEFQNQQLNIKNGERVMPVILINDDMDIIKIRVYFFDGVSVKVDVLEVGFVLDFLDLDEKDTLNITQL